ncbi:MAG: cupredoxin domain-containing protein [Tepidisphaeraceae bacterium]
MVLAIASLAHAGGKTHRVSIDQMRYGPAALQIAAGDTVVWTNNDEHDHTVTSSDGSFKSGKIGNGESFEHTFTKPGKYSYTCKFHPRMNGTVVVGE